MADTTDTTLEAAPDPQDANAPAEAAATPPADSPRGDWRSVLQRLRDTSDEEEGDEPDSEDEDDETGTEQAADATPEAKEQADAKAPDARKAEEEQGKDPWEGKPFRITDADGRPQAIPESVRFAFTADGQEKTASLDELMSFAQKGVHADRKLSDQGRVVKSLETRLSHYDGLEKGFEQLLTKIAEGDETVLSEIKRAHQRLQDPEVRAAMEAKGREDARRQAEAAAATGLEEQLQTVWDDARAKFGEALSSQAAEYPFLAAEDADDVVQKLYDGYRAHQDELLERYEQAAKTRGVDVEAARQLAERDALLYLTAENLFGAMKALNDRIATRVGRKAPDAPTPKEKAEEHNRYIETKQKQGETRTLRGGGGLDPAAGKKMERPQTFADHKARVRSIIRRAAS